MHKTVTILMLGFFFFSGSGYGQDRETDSLIQLLATAKEDTNKVMLYWKTGVSIVFQDPQASVPWFKKGTDLALKLEFFSGIERCYSGTALAFSNNAKYDTALKYISYAIPYAVKAGSVRRLALVYLNRADVYTNLHKYKEAMQDCDTAIQYAEKANSIDALGRIYGIMSGIYRFQKQFQLAGESIDKSLGYLQAVNNQQMIAIMYSDKADMFFEMGKAKESIPYYLLAIKIGDSVEDVEGLAAYYNGLAQSYSTLKRYAEAEAAANEALKRTEQTGNINQQANIYQTFMDIATDQKNYDKAIGYGEKSYAIFKQKKDLMREQMAVNNLAEVYSKSGNNLKAYEYLKIARDLNDSLVKQQYNNEIAELQTTFGVKQKDKEILLLNKDKELQTQRIKEQRSLMFSAILLAILALTGTWLFINRNKLKQRMKELELRNRLAADLHDEVGSSLSSIHMLSQMANQQEDTIIHRDILSKMSTNAKETMDRMGDIVWMIKPGETESQSLKQRIERFAYEIGSSKNIEVSLQLDELEKAKLSMEQRKNVYLIFKEAVNNAAKYSETKKISIESISANKELILTIRDEGKGFNSNTIKKGNGLDNMRNRALELGAGFSISSDEGKGTTIKLSVPV